MKKITILLLFIGFISPQLFSQHNRATPAPDICMVTVDDNSINNIIYWDKTIYTDVDSFIVYREVLSSVYLRIGSVSFDSLSQYIDTARSIGPAIGDPNVASYRYKLQTLDTLGNYSALSPYHSTIYIVDAGAGQFDWSIPYTIEGAANPVTNYVLLCDTANINFWSPVDTVGGTQNTCTDPGFVNHSTNANWRVKTLWPITCTPTRNNIHTTRSNIKRNAIGVGISSRDVFSGIRVYPNPSSGIVTVEVQSSNLQSLKVFNVMGELMYQSSVKNSKMIIDISSFAKGIYTIEANAGNGKMIKKLVVE